VCPPTSPNCVTACVRHRHQNASPRVFTGVTNASPLVFTSVTQNASPLRCSGWLAAALPHWCAERLCLSVWLLNYWEAAPPICVMTAPVPRSTKNADVFRSVPLARALCGTKMGKKAYFCYRLLQARGSTVKQRSRKTPILCLTGSQTRALTVRQTSRKTPIFVPACPTRRRSRWDKHRRILRPNVRKMQKTPIFVPLRSTCLRANWNKHRVSVMP
jgi:hypothetical protein